MSLPPHNRVFKGQELSKDIEGPCSDEIKVNRLIVVTLKEGHQEHLIGEVRQDRQFCGGVGENRGKSVGDIRLPADFVCKHFPIRHMQYAAISHFFAPALSVSA